MTIIQQARDALAKWRNESSESAQPWSVGDRAPEAWASDLVVVACEGGEGDVTDYIAPADARLIVGTAGNPALFDAIDALLSEAGRVQAFYPTAPRVKDTLPLAAAIIAADERMSA